METNLNKLKQVLEKRLKEDIIPDCYYVPDVSVPEGQRNVNPFEFFLSKLNEIDTIESGISKKKSAFPRPEIELVYNLLVRLTTSYDHNGDGVISADSDKYGMRETGTFLKTIALIPYIHSLGVNTLYLLPVTSIGADGRKGNLGSPYSIKNPYKLDENLREPFLGMSVEEQFAALVEAAHKAGMKVICEFVFRTASLDSDLALSHPEWFYWIDASIPDSEVTGSVKEAFKAPEFSPEEIEKIKLKVQAGDFDDLTPPDEKFKAQFTDVPTEVFMQNGKIFGLTAEGRLCRIPSAFADWPPDDNQPPWKDVTYLRLYDNPDFNYIAYNTVRMYDTALAKPEFAVTELWESIKGIIPYYIESFGIDGVMLDMGHALPLPLRNQIISSALAKNRDFVFWEENFTLSEKSREEGYSAVAGYMPFDAPVPWKLKRLIELLCTEGSPVPFFLTAETHNTPRSAFRNGGVRFSEFCWAMNCLLEGVLFIHSGFELCEIVPVNTGLDFTEEGIALFPAEKLPLFSATSLNWKSEYNIIGFMKKLFELRTQLFSDGIPNYRWLETRNDFIISFVVEIPDRKIFFAGNSGSESQITESFCLPEVAVLFRSNEEIEPVKNEACFSISLEPYDFFIGEL